MITKLIGRTGEVAGRDFLVPADAAVLRIGAAADSDICIQADGVSRSHARIVRKPDGCWVEDAGSSNGTFINGLRLKAERLRHLDVVTLARHVDLIFLEVDREAPQPSAPVFWASLEFLNGPKPGDSVEIPEGELSIGRGAACQVVISHPAVGKTHARIARVGGHVTIEDLHSANGTFVNDQRVGIAVLKNEDRISIAGVSQLRLLLASEGAQGAAGRPIPVRRGPEFDQEWRTRLVWSPTERGEIERNQAKVLDMMDAQPRPAVRAPAAAPMPAAPRPLPAAASPIPPPVTSFHSPHAAKPPSPPPAPAVATKPVSGVELSGGPEGAVTLGPGVHTIGRRGVANVRLPDNDREASRIHAQLTVSAQGVQIEDRSVNGTFVNGDRLTAARQLRDGDKVRCGSATFSVRLVR